MSPNHGYALLVMCAVATLASACSFRSDQSHQADLLFVREESPTSAIYLMSHEGGEVRRLVEGGEPRWSPDGTRFAYRVDEHGDARYVGTSLWVMDPASGKRRLVVSAEGIGSFAWAPDGVRLAYVTTANRIFVVDTRTGQTVLGSIHLVIDGPLDWSPDGHELLVASTSDITILDLRNRSERELAPRLWVGDGSWSPDGTHVAFAQRNARWNPRRRAFDPPVDAWSSSIVVADRDRGRRERVTDGAFDSEPAWSADGRRVYFTRAPTSRLGASAPAEQEIYVVDLTTRSLQRLTENGVSDHSPDPRPARRPLPEPPEPPASEVVVPDLVGRHVHVADVQRRLRALGLILKVLPARPEEGWLGAVLEQVPGGGARVPVGTVVKVDIEDLHAFHSGKRFSATVWKVHPGCRADNPRGPMSHDLVDRVLRLRMSRREVAALLGPPEASDGRASVWPLGVWTTVPVGCIYLRIEFDGRGRVAGFRQWAR